MGLLDGLLFTRKVQENLREMCAYSDRYKSKCVDSKMKVDY